MKIKNTTENKYDDNNKVNKIQTQLQHKNLQIRKFFSLRINLIYFI